MNSKYTVIDLFAGTGGLSKAFQEAGAEIVWANEIDKYSCNLYKENFKNVCLVEGDIKNIECEKIPNIDILVGGFPCHHFSLGGQINGINDDRENLFFEIIRILKVKKPRAFLLENVKGLMSHDKGRIFNIIVKALKAEGYYTKSKVINNIEYANIPHNKERVYIVGFRDINDFEIYEFPDKIKLNLQINDIIDINEKKENKYYYSENSRHYLRLNEDVKVKGRIHQLKFMPRSQHDSETIIIKDYDFCPALTSYINRKDYVPVIKDNYGIRMLTPDECFVMQGFGDFKFPKGFNENRLYKYAAGCSSVKVVKRIAENIIKTLDCDIQDVKLNNSFKNKVNETFNKIDQQTTIIYEKEVEIKKIIEEEEKEELPINNEQEFTLQKVIPALKNKDFFDIKYNHGNDEYGKDVIYKYIDNFGITKCGAVQVKYGNICGGAKSDIDLILGQIEDAFYMPFGDIRENRKIHISQLLIICSGRYTKNATEKIIEKLKKGYDVRFFDGEDIDNW